MQISNVKNQAQACACGGACNHRDVQSPSTSSSSHEIDSDMEWDDFRVGYPSYLAYPFTLWTVMVFSPWILTICFVKVLQSHASILK